jgi:hypothetical protein
MIRSLRVPVLLAGCKSGTDTEVIRADALDSSTMSRYTLYSDVPVSGRSWAAR